MKGRVEGVASVKGERIKGPQKDPEGEGGK